MVLDILQDLALTGDGVRKDAHNPGHETHHQEGGGQDQGLDMAGGIALEKEHQEADPQDIALARAYLGLNQEEGPVWGMIRGGMGSVSRLCVIQMQDYLELDGSARMNFPGTLSSDNWTWRAGKDMISSSLAERILQITRRYGRA